MGDYNVKISHQIMKTKLISWFHYLKLFVYRISGPNQANIIYLYDGRSYEIFEYTATIFQIVYSAGVKNVIIILIFTLACVELSFCTKKEHFQNNFSDVRFKSDRG